MEGGTRFWEDPFFLEDPLFLTLFYLTPIFWPLPLLDPLLTSSLSFFAHLFDTFFLLVNLLPLLSLFSPRFCFPCYHPPTKNNSKMLFFWSGILFKLFAETDTDVILGWEEFGISYSNRYSNNSVPGRAENKRWNTHQRTTEYRTRT